jgi:uncharacterized membrane protein
MNSLGALHVITAVIALASGAVVLLRRKGTASHRRIGWVYVASMLALNITALAIYRLTKTFGPFHVAALFSLATVVAAIIPAWRRKPRNGWLDLHYYFMSWSYLGLLAATVAEVASRVPAIQAFGGGPTPAFWTSVAVASAAVFLIGGPMIKRRFVPVTQPFRGKALAD